MKGNHWKMTMSHTHTQAFCLLLSGKTLSHQGETHQPVVVVIHLRQENKKVVVSVHNNIGWT